MSWFSLPGFAVTFPHLLIISNRPFNVPIPLFYGHLVVTAAVIEQCLVRIN